MVCVFKQPFSVFKQHFTNFNALFHPYVFPQIFSNNNFQFLNTCTKHPLSSYTVCVIYCYNLPRPLDKMEWKHLWKLKLKEILKLLLWTIARNIGTAKIVMNSRWIQVDAIWTCTIYAINNRKSLEYVAFSFQYGIDLRSTNHRLPTYRTEPSHALALTMSQTVSPPVQCHTVLYRTWRNAFFENLILYL